MNLDNFVYRAFPVEVVSNPFDFEVRLTILNNRLMHGLFSTRGIEANECPLFIGVYPGYRRTIKELTAKSRRISDRAFQEKHPAVQCATPYAFWLGSYDPGYVLDPTDEDGELLPEFAPFIVSYAHEPPPKIHQTAAFVYDRPRQRYEVWLMNPVERDEEVFLYYGNHYLRDYPINLNSTENPFAYYIPEASIFKDDPRCVPPALLGQSRSSTQIEELNIENR
jgi:hypothetical protein